ncbi:MAG: Arsenite methyltransferase [Phycisphaerae bacterium]|nr:Arsenite methyltransferase [Phycisphaerae bacterium]
MANEQDIRERVSRDYTLAVTSESGCCCGSSKVAQKGVVSRLAGYGAEELAALPAEAVVNSFGCGNPLAFSEVRAGQVVLDLGSGAGIDVLLAGKKVGSQGRAIGIDMTEAMLAKARENIAASGLANVEVRRGTIEHLPVENSSVDWVISNCVINLSPEKPRVFAEIARVLKPGGRMLVSDIVAEDLPEWMRNHPRLYSSCVAGAINEQEYLAGLRAAGLIDAEVRDRLVYDATQLTAFITSELQDAVSCGDSGALPELGREQMEPLVGKIYSALIAARKPSFKS